MSWIQKLYETYERCANAPELTGPQPWPIAHLVKRAHVEVAIDAEGNFRRAQKLDRLQSPTLIPATEASAGRTAGVAAHPLCEEIGYCAADYPGLEANRYSDYEKQLEQWCSSEFSHPKARAIYAYLRKGLLWSDLNAHKIFPVAIEDAHGKKTKVKDEKVFLRWRVETPGEFCSGTWEDDDLIDAWISFDRAQNHENNICIVTGATARIGRNHSRFLRHPGDGAKLISVNDAEGYTFRGRFTDGKNEYGKQACSVGFETSQKAHNALRWLIARQGYRNGDQAVVSWAINGTLVPDPFANTLELFGRLDLLDSEPPPADTAQAFALRLKRAIAGYRAKLDPTSDVVVMGLDSATPGRMAITFYRELKGSEFIERIEYWHTNCAWSQNFGKESRFVGAPAPRDIAEAAYGRRLDDKLRKATVERVLPCIVDSQPIPRDLVESTVRRASNRVGLENWEWEKCLGIACALFKGYHTEGSYQMALEQDRTSRDYLYGRLLAIAEHIEGRALHVAGEKRDTTAARLMQRFADRPYSTWKTIELSLAPYKTRLRAQRTGFLFEMDKLLDDVTASFPSHSFTQDSQLSGEFLLGYHCQRQALRPNSVEPADNNSDTND
ncbi:conserved hypothetical protein [Aromatoleum aromaticum EbN1]|uniref:Type I-C CRISPR-associated protein Cas8c/Csd1 n=1 Tax=Aromatoleum aromaticum (strain DSM 19018 / LMG 30748 / EbN1) TaxID=76114 RepID=Q5P3Y7_AROAE|nr:type I-C CRISPR-associated protein Cas8c/Csd1 [Aromatoleum aromaticum]CAI07976.1 conserved hypothetical protein [Aromatoleum aromaticum EbN1]